MLVGAAPYQEVREPARAVLSTHCGSCHIRGLETARPKALAVYDLTLGDFFAGMTEKQLESVKSRLASDLNEAAKPRDVPKADQELVARFIAAELGRRKK